jgi:hypothetical protein
MIKWGICGQQIWVTSLKFKKFIGKIANFKLFQSRLKNY